ncbi:MAG: Bifunctional uridylyltransferase/uridylyl-removing enzyme [Verrucomicrobiae bacterium]|nr:Bifunctional uridylyltransferase/uridylyl-removing enzyme [Verrucomicrobiae bacterium]
MTAQHLHREKVRHHAKERLTLKPGAKPAEILATYKRFLKVETHRLRLLHGAGATGREVAQGRADVMDLLLEHLFTTAIKKTDLPAVPLLLIAYGGYGRGELSPCSDLDIMFVHNSKDAPFIAAVVEPVLYALWDVGLKVGHSTRSIAEAVAQANSDMQSKTALIEARLLMGDRQLFEQFHTTLVKECVQGHEDEYIAARMEDQRARHEKYGDSVYLQEPNVKNGCGGLRDFQNLIWMAFFKHGALSLGELRKQGLVEPSEQRQLDAAYDFILRIRNALHYLTNRPCDSIALGLQLQLADDFGYRQHDVLRRTEAFMRDYYMHSRTIFLLTNSLAERMAIKPPRFPLLTALLRRGPKAEEIDGFLIRAGQIDAATPDVFKEDRHRMLRVFLYAQQRNAELSPDLQALVRKNLALVDRSFQSAPTTRDTLLAILQQKGQVARILRQMHEVEFLGKLLPEFGRLTCLVQHEFFHRYTADEHTLQVVEHLDRTLEATEPPHAAYRKLFQKLDQPHVLYLAVLLHDVGKAANAKLHAEASNEMAKKVAHRLRLGTDETAKLLFLVRDHLKLSLLSQRRDIDDSATIDAAVRIVKFQAYLDSLMLLTFADAAGTSIKTWSEWKQALLWELYNRTTQAIEGGERAKNILSKRIEQLYKEVSAKLKGQLPLEEIYSHFELMPASYYINTSADEATQHLLLIHRFLMRQLEVEAAEDTLVPVINWQSFPAQSYSRVSICTWDRLGLFSKIAGAFAAAELNVLSAHIYTRGDHVVLDHFGVCDRDLQAVSDQKQIAAAEEMLRRTLTNKEDIDFHQVLEKIRAKRGTVPRIREVRIPTVIDFDNEISQTRTVVEIQTEDRVGLLYALTSTLSTLGLDISFAKIFTEKGAAIDSFYVQNFAGEKITDEAQLANIREKLEAAIHLLAS